MSQSRNDAKCSFIYFLIFIGALVSCFGINGIWHTLNILYNGQIAVEAWQYDGLRHNMAALLVAFPFLSVMLYIAQINLHKESFTISNRFRRWIIYGGLSFGAIFVFHAFYSIVENFLGGIFIRKTIIDSAILISVVGLAIIFFLIDVTRRENHLTKLQKGLSLIAVIGFIFSIYIGFSHNKTHKEVEELTKKKNIPASHKSKTDKK